MRLYSRIVIVRSTGFDDSKFTPPPPILQHTDHCALVVLMVVAAVSSARMEMPQRIGMHDELELTVCSYYLGHSSP